MKKDDLLILLRQPVAFHPALARVAGGVTAGLMLSQLFYWMGRGQHPDGWIYKDWQDWERETCLTQDEQRGARLRLERQGLIEVSSMRALGIDKFSPTLCYRIRFERLIECLQHQNGQEKLTVDGDCRRAFKTTQVYALNFTQGLYPPVIGGAVDKCSAFLGGSP